MAKLNTGDVAPDFEQPWTGEGSFKLSDRRGRWVVLAFYPGDETSVCTKQMCEYRDNSELLDGLDAEVVGISPQGVDSHESFIANHNLTIPLVADEDLEVSEAYGIKLGSALRRSVFIVDPEGKIAHRDVKLVGLSYTDSESIAAALAEAQAAA
ncbi:MAG TPA: peroxiredoxin [Solirubrobacterales bacterium]|nr:peroxiredoxin [Solirubrobacterales bacterium]